MERHRLRWSETAAAALLCAAALGAQTTGRIDGRVVDDERQPLPGVKVTTTSPSLQGARTALAEDRGGFRLLALPPGLYDVRAELDGFNPVELDGIRVDLDRTVTLEIEMSRAFEEAVTVTAEAPILDTSGTTTGADFPEQVFADLPMSRTFQGLTLFAPGVTDSGLEGSPSIRGASGAENRYAVDGLEVSDPLFGTYASSQPFEFVDAVEVKTGGYPAEYGGALGGVVNVITKSGSNEFRGDLFAYFVDDGLQASSPPTRLFGQDLGFTRYDFGLDLGGSFRRDKLWYFAALNPNISEEELTNRQSHRSTPRTERLLYAGKLTWQVGRGNQLVASMFGDSGDHFDTLMRPGFIFDARNSAGRITHDGVEGTGGYALSLFSTPAADLFVEVIAGRHDDRKTLIPATEGSPWYQDSTGTGLWARQQGCGDPDLVTGTGVLFVPGCLGGYFDAELNGRREQLRGALSWFSHHHEWKAGIDYRNLGYIEGVRYPGPSNGPLVDGLGVVVDPDGLIGGGFDLLPPSQGLYQLWEFDLDSSARTEELALFIQDRWRPAPYLTFNFGVRLDSLEATNRATRSERERSVCFGLDEMIAPRLGFAWDVTGDGRSKLSGHYGRFYESLPMVVNINALGRGRVTIHLFAYPFDGSLPSYENLGIYLASIPIGFGRTIDPGTEPMYTDEFVLGYRYQLRPEIAVGVSAVHRQVERVIEDISVDGGQTFFLTNPGGSYTVNPVTGQPLAEAVIFPEATREYRALELTFEKRLVDDWQLFASYVYSNNEGNYGGLYQQEVDYLLPHLTAQFDLAELLVGAEGPLPNDRPHQLKVYGTYVAPFGLTAGFFGQYMTGTPINKFGGHVNPLFFNRLVTPRGSPGRTPGVWHLDLHLEYPTALPGDLRLRLIADLFNVTNEQEPLAVDQTWTFARLPATVDPGECGGPGTGPGTDCFFGNPLWGTPTAYQTPRTLRLGAKLSW